MAYLPRFYCFLSQCLSVANLCAKCPEERKRERGKLRGLSTRCCQQPLAFPPTLQPWPYTLLLMQFQLLLLSIFEYVLVFQFDLQARPRPLSTAHCPAPSTWFQLNWVEIGADAFRRVANATRKFICLFSLSTDCCCCCCLPLLPAAWHLIVFLRFSFSDFPHSRSLSRSL